jgi:hypothetical protein
MKKLFILAVSSLVLFSCNEKKKEEGKMADEKTMSGTEKKPATELLDLKEADGVGGYYDALCQGDIDAMAADFDDNIRFTFSSGDSLIGKKAVVDYWKNRRANIIKTLSISNRIMLPIMVNESQQPTAAPPGKWVLFWGFTDVTYKNDKSLKFWAHSVNHYNAAGKIDFIGWYIDRQPIAEATKDLIK